MKITSIPAEVTKLNVQVTESKEPSVRVYHAIERDGNGYDSIENIVTNAEKEAKLMTQCIKDIRYFKEKYIVLRDVMPTLFDAIEKELQRMEVAS